MIMFLYHIYKWIIAYPLLIVITLITAIVTGLGCVFFNSNWWGYYPPHIWGKCWCWLLFVKIEVKNRENIDKKTSYVFVANHQGAYDIFTIYGFLNHNFKWMMKKSIEKIPFVGIACKLSGHIMVDRSSSVAMSKSIEAARKRLQNGMSLVIFPEGARTWNGKMKTFKRGAFKLAFDLNLPIVPITIDGSFNVFPRTSKLNIKPGKITITIHKPIYPENKEGGMEQLMEDSFNAIQSSLPVNLRTNAN